jgi:hypothetical protein
MFTLPTIVMHSGFRKETCLVSGRGLQKIPVLDDLCLTRVHHLSFLPLRRLEPLVEDLQRRSNAHPDQFFPTTPLSSLTPPKAATPPRIPARDTLLMEGNWTNHGKTY